MLMRNDGIFELGCDVLAPVQVSRIRAIETPKHCTVGLLVDRASRLADAVARGVGHYLKENDRWRAMVKMGALRESLLPWLRQWRPRGVLVLSDDAEIVDVLERERVGVVMLGSSDGCDCPSVCIDETEVGRLAARHLLERSIRSFGVLEDSLGAESFQREIEAAGFPCGSFTSIGRDRLTRWIGALPKPVGILVGSDERGLEIISLCEEADISVPEEVAVVSVGNDESLCELASASLSSVHLNAEALGYEAMALLDRLMDGESETESVKVAPRGVVARRSTDSAISDDEEVTRAIRYIRAKACEGLQVSDVLSHMAMSRGSLQQRMKQTMGRTIHQEIHRVRLERAKELLANSDLAVKQVAKESGFASVQYMTRVFRAGTGETPASYRRLRMVGVR